MKRKILFSLLIIVVLFTITGCGKGVKTEDGKTAYKCFKKGIENSESVSGTNWKQDITFTVKLTDEGKLNYYSTLYKYMYNSKEDCNNWCDIKVKWNDEINANNYTGGHRVTTCKCENNELMEEYVYDDIENLASILRSDIKDLNADNTFNLDSWLQKRESNGYNCN